MKTTEEIEKIKREIEVLREAKTALPIEDYPIIDKAIQVKVDRLATLTTPQIKDGVLGIGFRCGKPISIISHGDYERSDCDSWSPLTIEDLLHTLAQWVPGAVRWRYCCRDRIDFFDGGKYTSYIPAPPRDDWEGIEGEL